MADIIHIKPSDSRSWLHCRRRVWYENFPPEGFEVGEPYPFDALIMKMGINHEWSIKRDLEKEFQVIEAVSNEHTLGLMKAEWVEPIMQQCHDADVAFFFKQWGMWGEDGVKRSKAANGRLFQGKLWDGVPALDAKQEERTQPQLALI